MDISSALQFFCFFLGREIIVAKRIRSVEGIAVDWISKNLYFTENVYGKIEVVSLRSPSFQDRKTLFTDLTNPRAIVLHPEIG